MGVLLSLLFIPKLMSLYYFSELFAVPLDIAREFRLI